MFVYALSSCQNTTTCNILHFCGKAIKQRAGGCVASYLRRSAGDCTDMCQHWLAQAFWDNLACRLPHTPSPWGRNSPRPNGEESRVCLGHSLSSTPVKANLKLRSPSQIGVMFTWFQMQKNTKGFTMVSFCLTFLLRAPSSLT